MCYEDQCTFLIVSPSFLLKIRNVSDEFEKKLKTLFFFQ